MKLSIITINKDNVAGLDQTIGSVIKQSFSDYEWIVIDGCSTDGSKELIEKNSGCISFWVSETDSGIYNAMNKGILKASGDYLLFLNSGDRLFSPDTLNNVFKRQIDADIIYGDYVRSKNNRNIGKVTSVDEVTFFGLSRYSICHNVCFIRKKLMLRFLYDENLKIVADWKFFMQALLSGGVFRHINECIAIIDMQGVSNVNKELHERERSQVMEDICPVYLKREMLRVNSIMTVESYLANTPLDRFVEIRERHPVLGKIITVVVLIMKSLG